MAFLTSVDEVDQNVYANKHKERPDRLIDMLTSSHRKVLACVVCGRLKSAFQIASRSGSVADVQYVAHQALHANALPVLYMCKEWLAQYMECVALWVRTNYSSATVDFLNNI